MHRFRRLLGSVRIRLTLWYLLILGLVFLVFGAIVYTTTLQAEQNTANVHLVASAQQLARDYDSATGRLQVTDLWNGGKGLTDKTQVAVTDYPLGVFDVALLLDTQGNDIQSLGPVTPAAIAQLRAWETLITTKQRATGDLRIINLTDTMALNVAAAPGGSISPAGNTTVSYNLYMTAVQSGGSTVAWLIVGQPDQQSQSVGVLVPGLLIAGPATLLLAALGGYWLATRAMRPVQLITHTARQIGETDLSRRLNLKRGDELGDLAATFDGMLARLEAAFARQRQFTADASHELRTPLAIVGLEVERALTATRAPAEYAQTLAVVQAENVYMSRMVNDLLTLARADAGQAALQWDAVDLGDVVLDAVERLAPLARAQGITLQTTDLPELLVTADRAYLAQMLANLIENGIKYTAGVGSCVSVTIGREVGGTMALIRVADDGPGIPPEHLPHIFERFYRVDEARTQDTGELGTPATYAPMLGGSGLGLALVEEIARLHGGEVRVQSEVGCGSVFEVLLPLASNYSPLAMKAQ